MWNNEADICFSKCTGQNFCTSFRNTKGWGCRLLKIIPATIPHSEREKAELFSEVYSRAEQLGVVRCKNFNPLRIDEVLDDDAMLRSIIDSGG